MRKRLTLALISFMFAHGAAKPPLYLVLRMDDTQYGYVSNTQKSIVEWALNNQVKFNFGIISGPDPNGQVWPTTCHSDPEDKGCDDDVVKAIYNAYADKKVRGHNATGSEILEIFDHSWNHNGWGTMSEQGRAEDLTRSTNALRTAFPEASIRTFVPPQNVATHATLMQMNTAGLDILSSQGTLGCVQDWKGDPNRYNYMYAPCQPDSGGSSSDWYCIPPKDVYITKDGFQTMEQRIFSTPTGSANTLFNDVRTGLEVKDVVGSADSCGCVGATCSIIGAALNNAKKSDGVMWAILMMHPFTEFPGQSYTQWLDNMLTELHALQSYDVQFVHFQDLVALHAPSVVAFYV